MAFLVFDDQVLYSQLVVPVSPFALRNFLMKYLTVFLAALLVSIGAASAFGQGKGVDTQSKRISDGSSNKAPANNGAKQDTGTTGSGINFGGGKTAAKPVIPNPYRVTARRDAIIRAVAEVMRDRKLIVDDAASKPAEGIIVSQPYTFIKGAVVTQSELHRYADVDTSSRGWTRGRYTILVEIQAIDGMNSNVSVTAKIEGRTDGANGAEWLTLQSTNVAEQEFLGALIESITGANPGDRP
jgi:hypothetical protein